MLKYQPRVFFEFNYIKETTWIKWVYTSNFFSCAVKPKLGTRLEALPPVKSGSSMELFQRTDPRLLGLCGDTPS